MRGELPVSFEAEARACAFRRKFVREKPAQGLVAIALPTAGEGELPAVSLAILVKDRYRLAPGCWGHAATSDSTLTYASREMDEVFL
jgi:hypothetical protein